VHDHLFSDLNELDHISAHAKVNISYLPEKCLAVRRERTMKSDSI
jgi:hypothetical protein